MPPQQPRKSAEELLGIQPSQRPRKSAEELLGIQPSKPAQKGVAEAEAALIGPYDPAGYDRQGRPLTPQREAFERKPFLERKFERAMDELRAGGLDVSRMARRALGFAAGGPYAGPMDFPAWREREEERRRNLAEREQARPPMSFSEEIGGGIVRAVPTATGAISLGTITGGGALGTAAIGGGMSAAGADWSNPKRAVAETALGAVAPVVGGRIGREVGGRVAARLGRPAAQTAARAGGEVFGGGAANVLQSAALGERSPRELVKAGVVGGALSAPGAMAAARRPAAAQIAEPLPDIPIAAPESTPAASGLPAGVRVIRVSQGEQIPPRQPGQRQIPLDIEQPDGSVETVLVISPDRINGRRADETTLRPMAESAIRNPQSAIGAAAAKPASAVKVYGVGEEPAAPGRGRALASFKDDNGNEIFVEHPRSIARRAAVVMAKRQLAAQQPASQPEPVSPQGAEPPPPPNPRNTRGAIIAQPSSLPSRKLLPPGRPEDVPTEQLDAPRTRRITVPQPDAPITQEMPAFRQRIEAENAPTAELPAVEARQPQQPPRPRTERLPVPKATEETIDAIRKRQEELGRLAYDRRGDFTGDLRDEYNQLTARIRDYDNEQARTALGGRLEDVPPPGTRPERMVPPTGELQARRRALDPKTRFASREDERQGHFERFDDDELIAEIARMEEQRNLVIRGKSRLTPAQREANEFDLKIAVEMQKERGRLQRMMGREAEERIAPRTPGRVNTKVALEGRRIQHSQFGEVAEAVEQGGVRKGYLRVIDEAGKPHVIRNPRTRGGGNREAAFVKSTGAIPAEAMPELRAPNAPPSPLAGKPSPAGQGISYAIPDEAMPEMRERPRSKGTIMGSGFGALQGLFERKAPKVAPKENPTKADIESAGLGKALGDLSRGAGNEMRTAMTILDFGAPGAQGFWLSASHPFKAISSGAKMFRSLSRAQSDAIDAEIAFHPLRRLWEKSEMYTATSAKLKGDKAGGEEAYRGVLARAPGFRAFERAFRTYLDVLRVSVFEIYAKALSRQGVTFENNPKAYKDAAASINIGTGRGQLKKGGTLEKASDLMGAVAFAPRNLISNFQILDPVRYAKMEPAARRLALKDSLTTLGVMIGTAALLRQMGVGVGFNPLEDDFMVARWGNTRYDLTFGKKTQVQFLARMVAGAYRQATGEGSLPGKDPLSVAGRFAEGKASPLISAALAFGRGRTFEGKKLADMSKGEIAWETAPVPILMKDLVDAYRQEGATGLLKTSPAILGARVSTYPDRAKAAFLETPDALRSEQKQFGQTRSFLTPRRAEKPGEVDETPAQFSARKAQADRWTADYGRRLTEFPRYKSAEPAIREAALDYLKRTIADQSGEKRPSLYLLRPSHVLATVRQSARKAEREKRREAATQ